MLLHTFNIGQDLVSFIMVLQLTELSLILNKCVRHIEINVVFRAASRERCFSVHCPSADKRRTILLR